MIGDTTYGRGEHNRIFRDRYGCERLLLHAWSLQFSHPSTQKEMYFEAPLDPVFSSIIRAFDWLTPLQDWQKTVSRSV
jgi:tRNA pseudouridine65 synthase